MTLNEIRTELKSSRRAIKVMDKQVARLGKLADRQYPTKSEKNARCREWFRAHTQRNALKSRINLLANALTFCR